MSEEPTFQDGDVVQAKCGGPAMTVAFVSGNHVETLWFVKDKLYKGIFPPSALKIATPEN